MPGELLVRSQDLEDPGAFYRAFRRRLHAGFRFVYDDPRLGALDTLDTLLARIRDMDAPPEFLTLIARDDNARIRAAVAGNAALALDDLRRLALDDSPLVRRGAAAHPWAPPALLRLLASDAAPEVRAQVGMHLATPPEVLMDLVRQALVRSSSVEYLAAVAEHPRTPAPALTMLAIALFRDGWLVARRPHLPAETIEAIIAYGPERCRADLARNPTLDAASLDRLAADSIPLVRIAVARNLLTAEETIERLLRDPDPAVRAANPRSSGIELIRLVDVRSRVVTEQVASNPATPPPLLDRLARTWDSDVHAAVAANASAPPETLRHLFRAGGETVRRLCLENPNCPVDLLRSRAGAPAPQWRALVAANPRTPQEILQSLAADPAPEVIAGLSGNPALLQGLQRRLLRHAASLPSNPLTPPELLWRLAIYDEDDHFAQRRLVLANPGFAGVYEAVASWREDISADPSA